MTIIVHQCDDFMAVRMQVNDGHQRDVTYMAMFHDGECKPGFKMDTVPCQTVTRTTWGVEDHRLRQCIAVIRTWRVVLEPAYAAFWLLAPRQPHAQGYRSHQACHC